MGYLGQQQAQSFTPHYLSNPIIRKLSRVTDSADDGHCASYVGIGMKTGFFLLLTLAGVGLYFALNSYFLTHLSGEELLPIESTTSSLPELIIVLIAGLFTILTPILAWAIRPTIPVTGSLYSLSQGYLIAFSAASFGGEYQSLVWLALGITVLIVFLMYILYSSRLIKVDKKFFSVIKTLFFTSIFASLGVFLCSLFPATSKITSYILANPAISIGGSVLFVVIAALFLLSDFDTIEKSVENKLPKKYEWAAAFGLAFTVIWLYLKVLSLLTKLKKD